MVLWEHAIRGFCRRISWGSFSWDRKVAKKWTRWRGQDCRQRSAHVSYLCDRRQLGMFHGRKKESLAGTERRRGDFNWESQVTREMSHLEPCWKTNMTAWGREWNGRAKCRELYSFGHSLINSQAATTEQGLCMDQSGFWVVKLSPDINFFSDLSKLFSISFFYL